MPKLPAASGIEVVKALAKIGYDVDHSKASASSCLQTCSKRVCLDCGLEAHRDAVGVLNMAACCGEYAVRPMV